MKTTILAIVTAGSETSFNWGTLMFVLGAIFIIFVISGFILSWKTINSNETGWMTYFGSDGKALEPGLRFCPWLISKVVKYEKTPLIFKLKVSSAMTKNGIVKDYKEDGGEIERTDLDIYLTLTTYFDHHNLAHTAANAPGNDAKSLGPILEPFIIGLFRSVASEMPWPLFNGERTKIIDYALSKIVPNYEYYGIDFKPEGKSNLYFFKDTKEISENEMAMMRKNPIVQFGLDTNRTTIEIEDINFSNPELAKIFNLAEESRLKGEADRIANGILALKIIEDGKANAEVTVLQGTANAEKIKKEGAANAEVTKLDGSARAQANAEVIKQEGQAMATARKLMIAEIKDNPDLEYLRTLEQMAKGTSNTILYQIPKSFEEKVSAVLGGSKPEDFFALLKDEKIITALKEALDNLKN